MIHIAVLRQPYAQLILEGRKTVECRLTKDARAPFEAIEPGERIYFKLSAGPYVGMASAEHVMCEGDLTPARVRQLHRDYNELICGHDDYWAWKKQARYATLIWLRDVRPMDVGPHIRNLQGVAWLSLDEEPAWRKPGMLHDSFALPISEANIRHNTLYVTAALEHFPKRSIGGRTKAEAGRPMTLHLHGGPTVETDIVGPRKLIRSRIWGRWFREHDAQPGDFVVFSEISPGAYQVGLMPGGAT